MALRYNVSRNLLRDTSACTALPLDSGNSTKIAVTLTSANAPVTVTDGVKTYTAEYAGETLRGMPEWFAVSG